MVQFQKFMVRCLAAVLLLSCLSAGALQVRALEPDSHEDGQTVTVTQQLVPDAALPDNEELYAGYVERLFYGTDSVSLLGELGRDQLNPLGQKLYGFLKTGIQKIAAGETSSTVLTLQASQAADWGAETAFTASDGSEAFSSFLAQFEIKRVFYALLNDCPYDLYWYDKVTGLKETATLSISGGQYSISSVSFLFAVAGNYQPEDYDAGAPTFRTEAAKTAVAASENARAIAADYADCSDSNKLKGYKNAICSLVSYDKGAAVSGDFSTNSDPWQLIYVFDNDPYTNVVCEGYSKAFQYLCDITQFRGDVSCYTVTGTSNGSGHMWNIVTIHGANYLADVTNSDSGTAGQSGSLFLTGGAGGISEGYTLSGVKYLYDMSATTLWGTGEDSILILAGSAFIDTLSGTCGDSLSWALDEATNTLTISGSGAMYDYDSDSAPWAHLAGILTTVNVDPGVTHIGAAAFANCKTLTSVTLPDTLTSIGADAFQGCTGLTLCVGCGSCGETYAKDNDLSYSLLHQWESAVTEPTCTTQGFTTHTCANCGERYTDTYVDMLEHTFGDWTTMKEATCTEAGRQSRECSVCGASETRTLNAAGHSYEDTVTAPTCTENGYTTHICSVCGDSYVDTYVDAPGHSYGAWETTKAATCTKTGLQTRTCSVCEKTETQTASATGHSYQDTVTAPTCGEKGYTTHTCTICGDSYVDSYVDATGEHVYTDDLDTTCDVCGYVRELPAPETVPVYRLYNPYTQEHLLTGEEEKDILVSAGWSLDGLAWKAPTTGYPVYRLYNPYGDFHFYSTSEEEIATLTPLGWAVDGVVSYSADAETGRPVYRLFNPYAETNYHIFTASEEESAWLVSLGWQLEGVAWYCV